ncbi:MAG TPA: PAS domain S-box protein [Chitinophagales bacterium]|nr:PAS domain S-box protein [Chitinophagales bacterium]
MESQQELSKEIRELQQRQLFDSLSESEYRHRQLVQGLPAAIYTCDARGYIQYYNKAAAILWGREPEIGKDLWCGSWRIYKPDGTRLSLDTCPMAIALKEGRPVYGVEIVIERPDGVRRNVLPHPRPIFDASGAVVEAVNMLVDITDYRNIEIALRESEQQFRDLADLVPQIVWTARPDGYLDYYNKQWYEYTGFEKGVSNDSFLPILHPDDVKICHDTYYDSIRTGNPYQIEYRFKDKTHPGSYRWFLGRALPIRDLENNIVKWFGTCTDIHETKMISEELERRVAERTKDLNEANLALQHSNQLLEQFAYAASHDLQEPLRKIKTFSDRLQQSSNGRLDETSKLYLEKITTSAARMEMLIQDVLNYSLLTHVEEPFIKTDLNEILESVITDLDILIAEKKASINTQLLPSIDVIPLQMHQLFHNLINNSLKFCREGVTCTIDIRSRLLSADEVNQRMLDSTISYCEIIFSDNGIGFNQNFAEQIFLIFQRLNARVKYAGTGIGLALCRKIINIHHGAIYGEGKENEGASFHVILPVHQIP